MGALRDALGQTIGPGALAAAIALLLGTGPRAAAPDAWYDPSDFSTLYTDHGGTTQVTQLEQTVALMLDKSKGLVRGAEMFTDGEFLSAGAWNVTQPTAGSSSVSGGKLNLNSTDGTYTGATTIPTVPAVIGTAYEWTMVVTSVTAGGVCFAFGGANGATITAAGTYRGIVFASSTAVLEVKRANGGVPTTAVIESVSCKPLPGYHVGQTTSSSRAVVSARFNLLLATDGNLASGSWSTGANISGTVQGDGSSLIARTSTAAAAYAGQSGVSVQIGMPFVAKIKVKKATIGNLYGLRVQGTYPDRADAVINLDTGAVAYSGGTSFTGISATTSGTPDADGFYTLTLYATVANSAVLQLIHGPALNATASWEATSGTLLNGYAKQPQIIRGSADIRYQRVTTATDYDSVGFPVFLRFDGTDDGIFTPYLPAGQTFPFTLVCALRATGNSLGGAFGLWGGAPPYYEIQKTSTANQWRAFDRGAVNYSNNETTAQVGTHVLTMEMTATTVNLRVDGTDPTAATTQDNTIGTLTDIRIGNGGGGFFGGLFFGGMLWFGTRTAAQLALAERIMQLKSTVS